ncbi:MAG TPA: hypothetical protein VGR02_13200 [Thermoanaerobaculia bacterium]|jgi:hypothetical protein|nr:hypothetical protein [Thermoanaerobaculia bacterium]
MVSRQHASFDPDVEATAERAVRMLHLDEDIAQMGDLLLQQIEDCETFAGKATEAESEPVFVTLTLALMNNLIHYACAPDDIDAAAQWVRNRWPEAVPTQDPVATLAALTLIHLVDEGARRFQDDGEKKKTWTRIRQRIARSIRPRAAVT